MPYPVTGGNNSSTPGTPGAPGQPGVNGKDGVGIASSEVGYQVSSSGDSAPNGSWSSSMPSVPKGKYLWTRTLITLTSGATTNAYSVSYVPQDGEAGAAGQPGSPGLPGKDGHNGSDGSPGKPGAAGVGVASSEISYQVSNTGDSPPSGRWSSSIPAVNKGQYLWVRTLTSLTDGSSTTAYALGYIGVDGLPGKDGQNGRDGQDGSPGVPGAPGQPGSPGAPGKDGLPGKDGAPGQPGSAGVGVASAEVSYQLSSSGASAPTGTWVSAPPTPIKGQYLWSRTITTYTNGNITTVYSVAYNALDGAPGSPGVGGKDGKDGISFTPQTMVSRSINVATAYQHTDTTKPYRVMVNARSTQTVTVAGLVSDKVELRVGPTAASVLANGSGGFSVGVWESGITGIALMVGAAVLDGGQISADVPAGWYFSVNRLAGTSATIVSCFTQAMAP